MKKIKSNQLEVGKKYLMALYSNLDTKIEIEVVKKPNCSIKCMKDSDRIVVESDIEYYEFYRNNSHPFFLQTIVAGRKDRAIFFEK